MRNTSFHVVSVFISKLLALKIKLGPKKLPWRISTLSQSTVCLLVVYLTRWNKKVIAIRLDVVINCILVPVDVDGW